MGYQARFENLLEIFDHSTESFANRDLFGTKRGGFWQWVTYAQFKRDVDRVRAGLSELGVGKGDTVAIIANNRAEWAVTAYAVFGLAANLVPMYEAQVEGDWEFILRDCEAKVLFVANEPIFAKTKGFLRSLPKLKHLVQIEGPTPTGVEGATTYRRLLEATADVPPAKLDREDVACLIYTSGTTGNPKGVILSHYNIASNISAIHDVFPMRPDDRSLSFLPWAHSFGQVVELHGLFSMGASMAIAESVDKILENLAEVRPTLLFSVPRIFNRIYAAVQKQISEKPKPIQLAVKMALRSAAKERARTRLTVPEHVELTAVDKLVFAKVRARFGGRLKYAFSGGAAISREVAEFIDALGITVYEGYGLTETSPISTANSPGERRIGSVGRAIPGVRIDIDPAAMVEKRNGQGRVEGEIVIYGPNIMKGYHKRPEENAAVFTKDGGFRSGDMGYLDGNGYLYITGRIKEQYKLENGKYVVPTPLEEELKLSPFVLNVMIYGDNRPYNVGLVVLNVQAVRSWAEQNQVTIPEGEGMLSHPRVRELLMREIAQHSKGFKSYEQVRDVALTDKDFTTDNGLLTPSLKLKRRSVLERYGSVIEALYANKREASRPSPAARV